MSGFFAAAGAVTEEVLAAVVSAAAHRGRARIWRGEGIGLVSFEHTVASGLWVEGGIAVALDGRLDDAAGLDGPSDAARFAEAWRRWGPGATDRVIGDFAAAVWHRGELWVTRDVTAGRPALIGEAKGCRVAGSSIPMLLAVPGLEREIDQAWVGAYLANVPGFATATGYRSIRRLVPGHAASATDAGWRARPVAELRVRSIRERDPRAYAEGFRERLDEAVRCRIRSASRVGVSLSGGLDSTSVAVAARAVRPDLDIVALCVPFEGPGDETELQASVAERAEARIRWVPLDGMGPFGEGIPALFDTYGTPTVAPNLFHVEAVADAGREEGIDVALDGIDGDSVVGGNAAFLSDLLVAGRWRRFLGEVRAYRDVRGIPRRRMARTHALRPLVPPGLAAHWVRARGRRSTPVWLDGGFARRLGLERAAEAEPWHPGATFRARERAALGPGIAPLILETMDEVWARRGITVAHPFGDRRLIEYCLGLPREQKVTSGMTKIVLRAAMRGLLPSEVAERPDKANLAGPFGAGLSGSQRGLVRQGLSLASSNPAPWLDPEEVERLGERFEAGRDLFEAYRVSALGHWIEWLSQLDMQGRRTHIVRREGTRTADGGTKLHS